MGLSWQIPPRVLIRVVTDPDRATVKRAFDAMMQVKKIDIAAIEAARRVEASRGADRRASAGTSIAGCGQCT